MEDFSREYHREVSETLVKALINLGSATTTFSGTTPNKSFKIFFIFALIFYGNLKNRYILQRKINHENLALCLF